jgi:hypothetical protein
MQRLFDHSIFCINQVICPLGCHVHYIKTKGKSFIDLMLEVAGMTSPNPTYKSRRKDWPYRGFLFKFEISAAVELKDDIPYILFCADHSDQQLTKEVCEKFI